MFSVYSNAQSNAKVISSAVFSLCESEFGACMSDKKCRVDLVSGATISLGSYIKVYYQGDLLVEGYILKHISGKVYILLRKEDAKNPEIHGGCSGGGAYEIFISKKQIWGC